MVEENCPRRGRFLVAFRRPTVLEEEERNASHVRDVEKLTANIDEEVLDLYVV